MSLDDAVEVVKAVGLIAAAIGSLLAYFKGRSNSMKLNENAQKLVDLHDTTNSKMDQLLQVTGDAEHAKGVIEGRGKK